MGRMKFIGLLSSSCHIFRRPVYTLSTVVEILRVNGFQFQMTAVRHRGFLKLEILTAGPVWRANMRNQAKFSADRSNRCGDMAVFSFFFKMAASAILDLKS